jgi:hypothetical protein
VIATPFVQGRLRNEIISIEVKTMCIHCERELHLTIDSNMQFSVREKGASPLVFMPEIDWANFAEQTIIDAY